MNKDNIRRKNIKPGEKHKVKEKYRIKGIHLNIRSINKNKDELKIMMTEENKERDWDFIALTECWANEKEVANINLDLEDYNYYNSKEKYNQNGGIMVYVNKSWDVEVSENENRDYGCEHMELNLRNNRTKKQYQLMIIYRNPGRNKNDFIQGIKEMTKSIKKKQRSYNYRRF